MSAVLNPLQGCSWNVDRSLYLLVRMKGNNVDGGFIDAWHTERQSMLLSTFKCAGFFMKQERLSSIKLKSATSFSHTLAAEPVSGESEILAAQEAPTSPAFAGRLIRRLL